jgi:hypothetical protein
MSTCREETAASARAKLAGQGSKRWPPGAGGARGGRPDFPGRPGFRLEEDASGGRGRRAIPRIRELPRWRGGEDGGRPRTAGGRRWQGVAGWPSGRARLRADARTNARWVEENGWSEERREKPEYGARTDTSCKLQNAMQLLLEAPTVPFGSVF